MKELFLILSSNKKVLLLILISFLLSEFTGNSKVLFFGSSISVLLASFSKLKILKNIGWRAILLLLIFVTYWLLSVNEFRFTACVQFVIPSCILFIIGRSMIKNYKKDSFYMGLFFIVALCTGIYNIVVAISDIIQHGIVNLEVFTDSKEMYGDNWRPSSLLAAELGCSISCISYFFILSKDKETRNMSLFGGIWGVIALVCTLHFISRSALLVAMICILAGVIFRFSNNSRKIVGVIIVTGLAVFLFMQSGFWEIMEYKNQSTDIYTGNGRTDRMLYWLKQVLKNPFGVAGYRNESQIFAHNFWIDFAKDAGWLPGIGLLLFSLLNIKDTIIVYKRKQISPNVKLVVISMTLAFTFAFSVEPIFSGAPNGMFSYFLFCGMVSALTRTSQF